MTSQHSNASRLATAALIVFVGILISKVLAYAFRIIVARHYGPDVYGSITLILAVMGLFVTLASLGLTDGLARYLPRYLSQRKSAEARYIIRFVAGVTFFTGLVAFILFYTGADLIQSLFFKSQEVRSLLHVFSFLLLAWLFTNIALVIISSYERIVAHSLLSDVLPNVLRLATVIVAVLLGLSATWVYGAHIISLLVIFFGSMFVARKLLSSEKNSSVTEKGKKEIRKALIAYSWPIIITGAVIKISTWIDSLMIGYMLNEAAVGFYNAALPLAALLIIVSESFFPLFFPLINKENARGNHRAVQTMTRRITKWALLCNIPLLILLVFFPHTIISLLFGTEYLIAASSLRILAIGFFFTGLLAISGKLLLMSGQSRFLLKNSIIFLLVSVILNALFIYNWGIVGAAWATALTLTFSSLSLSLRVHRETAVLPIDRTSLKIFFAAALSLGVFLFVNLSSASYVLQSSIFITYLLVYVLLLILFKTIESEDLALLHVLKKKLKRS